MKKRFILGLLIITLFSCETRNATVSNTDVEINGKVIDTYTIDSCEYIGYIYYSDSDMLTHKGNCKFCAQRNAKNK